VRQGVRQKLLLRGVRLCQSEQQRIKGDVTRCLVWTQELVDTEKIGDDGMVGSDTLYLRIAGLDAAGVLQIFSVRLNLLSKLLIVGCLCYMPSYCEFVQVSGERQIL
jgi:hypothetical protein